MELRQAKSNVEVIGIISEKNLKIDQINGKTVINGSVTVKTDDTNFIRFSVYCPATKNDGNPNPMYAGIQTVYNEYVSIADGGEEAASRVRVRGNLNPYHGRNGDIVSYRANAFSRVDINENNKTKAECDVELFVESITPEMGKNEDGDIEETGRMNIKGWMPTFAGIEPLTIVVPEEFADAVLDTFAPGDTAEFYADVINATVVKIKEIPVVIGKPKVEKTFEYKNELVLTGCSAPYEEDNKNKYDAEAIRAAKQEREDKIASANSTVTPTTNSKPSGASRGRTMGW